MEAREKFEALPEIANKMDNNIYYDDEVNRYYFKGTHVNEFYHCLLAWLNGAWTAFQEQQKIINMQECGANQIIEILNDFESSEKPASFYLRKIKELLK